MDERILILILLWSLISTGQQFALLLQVEGINQSLTELVHHIGTRNKGE